MDYHFLFTLALAILNAFLGWFAREMWDAVKSLKRDLSALEVKITEKYVSYDRLKDVMHPVLESLEEIKRALRDKADK
jgi:hypothetical protein